MAHQIVCYGQTRGYGWMQEVYETASKHAAARARQLRTAGYKVTTSAMGPQVTSVGWVSMTLLTVHNHDGLEPSVTIEPF